MIWKEVTFVFHNYQNYYYSALVVWFIINCIFKVHVVREKNWSIIYCAEAESQLNMNAGRTHTCIIQNV